MPRILPRETHIVMDGCTEIDNPFLATLEERSDVAIQASYVHFLEKQGKMTEEVNALEPGLPHFVRE